MTPEEIYELAGRYVDEDDFVTIPKEGELFALLQRELPDNVVLKDDEGWQFAGYAKCEGYVADVESKPAGKWIYLNYLSLATFPPQLVELKLQPPHIAIGMFQNPGRTVETRIVALNYEKEAAGEELEKPDETKIFQFPGKK